MDLGVGVKVFRFGEVDLVDDEEGEFVGEEGFDALEELDLGRDRVAALFGEIHEEEDGGAEVRYGGYGLHFDGVHFFERVVKYAGGVYRLES